MELNYTFEELKRERMTVSIGNLIREMAWQDKIVFFKNIETQEKYNHNESAEILTNAIAELDDEKYEKFITKLSYVLSDMQN